MSHPRFFFASRAFFLAVSIACAARGGEDHATSTNRHCLWKVSGPHNVVYLLGSIHVLKTDDYPLDQPIESAFTNAQVAAFETDMGKMEQPETQMAMLGKAQLPDGETL